jgi:hypothetical protein
MEWILLKEQKPKRETNVLVYGKNGEIRIMQRWEEQNIWTDLETPFWDDEDILYWMPLPEKPKALEG